MRANALLLPLMLLWLLGCQPLAPQAATPTTAPEPVLGQWLQLVDELGRLNPAEARQRLPQQPDSEQDALQRLRFALLNQQLAERDGWVVARDRLRALAGNPELAPELRSLATLLERFNQVQINLDQQLQIARQQAAAAEGAAAQAQAELQQARQQLLERTVEVERLEAKIQALTRLENSMQRRRDQQGGEP